MTRAERESLLERFLDGKMNLDEKHDFYIRVALDKELRLDLEAQQVIESAIRKVSRISPSEYMQVQKGVAAMLAAAPHGSSDTFMQQTGLAAEIPDRLETSAELVAIPPPASTRRMTTVVWAACILIGALIVWLLYPSEAPVHAVPELSTPAPIPATVSVPSPSSTIQSKTTIVTQNEPPSRSTTSSSSRRFRSSVEEGRRSTLEPVKKPIESREFKKKGKIHRTASPDDSLGVGANFKLQLPR